MIRTSIIILTLILRIFFEVFFKALLPDFIFFREFILTIEKKLVNIFDFFIHKMLYLSNMMLDIYKLIEQDLNEAQQEAVTYIEGPLLVIAGAGSGKTRVITYKIAFLLSHGYKPHEILAVTFTNKAANEMKERIKGLLQKHIEGLWVSTFHSFCYKILRIHGESIGLAKDFVIFDENDQRTIIRKIVRSLNLDLSRYKPAVLIDEISSAKAELLDYKFYQQYAENEFEEICGKVFELYEKELRISKAVDFDDLILYAYKLFENNKEIFEKYSGKFKYYLIDEYQDTNYAQHKLIMKLAKQSGNICVVGDPDQSIYGFRGAEVENILEFESNFPDKKVKIVDMMQNYRSTKNILKVANSLISKNDSRKLEIPLFTENEHGSQPMFAVLESDRAEAEFIAEKIKELSYRINFKDISILLRTRAQSRILEEVLFKRGIPYKLVGTKGFYSRMEVKDLISYLRLIANPSDWAAFLRIVNIPARGIGRSSLEIIKAYTERYSPIEAIDIIIKTIPTKRIINKLQGFLKLYFEFTELIEQPVDLILKSIIKRIDYKEYIKDNYPEDADLRIDNINELVNVAAEFKENFQADEHENTMLQAFLSHIALLTDADNLTKEKNAVKVMTVHVAKGLEFKAVFVPGLEEKLFPHIKSMHSEEDIKEERRLLYVAITRAKEYLFLSSCRFRRMYGTKTFQFISRFVEKDIPLNLFLVFGEYSKFFGISAGYKK